VGGGEVRQLFRAMDEAERDRSLRRAPTACRQNARRACVPSKRFHRKARDRFIVTIHCSRRKLKRKTRVAAWEVGPTASGRQRYRPLAFR
jgi:hypothetical protein